MQISQHVRVRGASWQIAGIRPYEDCQLVTLTARSPLNGPLEHQVLAPFDDIEPVARKQRARFARAGTWWRACRRLIAEDTPPGSLRSVHRANIDVLPHQLEPALAISCGLGSRVLLADEVGLGKTVQAGIVVSELRARGAVERALVLAPAGLREQWVQELSTRFGLEALLADASALRRLSATLPLGVNPWITTQLAVVSLDYVKRPEVLPVLLSCHWDIVIVDEAHAAAGDSDRQSAVAALASRAAYVLLLTATPHSGDPRSFKALCRMGAIGGDELLVFRRRRTDVRRGAIRKIHALHVRSSPQEVRLHALLERYVAAVCAEHDGAWLAASVLHKRALSSAWSLARSVERRLEGLRDGASGPGAETIQQPGLPFGNDDGEFSAADEEPGWPAGLGLRDRSRENRLLRGLHAAARAASTHESKLMALVRLLRRCHEPAIVFTEYRDTLLRVRTVLGRPASLLHGGLTRAERARAVADFTSGRLSVLLTTDAGGEGLNLHHTCRLVINLELPWNPMRLEQRIGRVDRIGQERTVHAVHLIAGGTAEPRILDRLRSRLARASTDIGVPDPVGMFGAAEDRATARLLALGAEEVHPAAEDHESVPRVTPDLRDAADREVRRLTLARMLIRGGPGGPAKAGHYRGWDGCGRHGNEYENPAWAGHYHAGDITMAIDEGPWIHRARRAGLRAALGRRILMLWRVACEDGCGRTVESKLIPLLVELNPIPHRWTRQCIDDLRRYFETHGEIHPAESLTPPVESGFPPLFRCHLRRSHGGLGRTAGECPNPVTADLLATPGPFHEIDVAIADWRDEAFRCIRAFLSTRLSRERTIQSQASPPQEAALQPGLFDRRAERARLAAAAARAESDAVHRSRRRALALCADVSPKPPELLLVLAS